MVNSINIEVAYAKQNIQYVLPVSIDINSTILDAIKKSGIIELEPDLGKNIKSLKVGIFSKRKALTDLVKSGDRVEIYRELKQDPMTARRNRALSTFSS